MRYELLYIPQIPILIHQPLPQYFCCSLLLILQRELLGCHFVLINPVSVGAVQEENLDLPWAVAKWSGVEPDEPTIGGKGVTVSVGVAPGSLDASKSAPCSINNFATR